MLQRIIRSSSRGQLIPLLGLSLTLLVAMAAFAVDVGYWRYQQRLEQTAADSAAIAGAAELNYPVANDWSAAAKSDASANGFTDDGGVTVRVTPNNPPTLGPYAGNTNAVEVIIKEKQPTLFGGALGLASQWVSVRAVAVLSSANRDCIYGLSPTAADTVLVNGAAVNAPHCGIISDSTSTSGLTVNGASVTASSIGYAGASATLNGATFPEAQPAHAIAIADPCPSIPGCAYLKANAPGGGTCQPVMYNGGSTATIPPGTYCSTLIVNGVSNVVFSAGVYAFTAGMTLNGTQNVSGTGVTFYNASGSITLNGTSVTLSAPTTGNTAGVLFYQAPSDNATPTLNGGSGSLAGMLYFSSANITVNGGLLNSPSTLVVSNTITINGSAMNMLNATSTLPGYAHPVLAE